MNLLQCLSNGTIDFNNLACYCGCGSGMGYFIILSVVVFMAFVLAGIFCIINKTFTKKRK